MICAVLRWGFLALYAGALVLLAVGTFGLLGAERDPLAGVFVWLLGLPWVLAADLLPERLWPGTAALAPLLTLALLWRFCTTRP